jgi:hypothetical protein
MFDQLEKCTVDHCAAIAGDCTPGVDLTNRVQEASRNFMSAQAAVVAFGEQGDQLDQAELTFARVRRDLALNLLRSLPARSREAVSEKIRARFVFEGWFGCEESIVGEFAMEVLREAAPFVCNGSANDIHNDSPPLRWAAIGLGACDGSSLFCNLIRRKGNGAERASPFANGALMMASPDTEIPNATAAHCCPFRLVARFGRSAVLCAACTHAVSGR